MNSATVCMLSAHLADIRYSMTVHGPHVFYEPMHWALPLKIERSAFTVCISNFTRSQCMAFVSPEVWPRLRVVRCGVDASLLDQPFTPVPESRRFLTIGRLSREKGQAVLIEAVAQLRSEGVPVELVIIGDGPARSEIEEMIEHQNLKDCVSMEGWQTSEQIIRQLSEVRSLVLASFAEGLPVVIMEALASYRPVIATQIAGVPELVAEGVNGWLVPSGSVNALADAMRQALHCPVERLTEMGRAGHDAVCRLHDRRKEVDKLEQLFRDHI
jgi:glycosyltransferase involved in cell wall biosynthesis